MIPKICTYNEIKRMEIYHKMTFGAAIAHARLNYLQISLNPQSSSSNPAIFLDRICVTAKDQVHSCILTANGIPLLRHGCKWLGCHSYAIFKDTKYLFCALDRLPWECFVVCFKLMSPGTVASRWIFRDTLKQGQDDLEVSNVSPNCSYLRIDGGIPIQPSANSHGQGFSSSNLRQAVNICSSS